MFSSYFGAGVGSGIRDLGSGTLRSVMDINQDQENHPVSATLLRWNKTKILADADLNDWKLGFYKIPPPPPPSGIGGSPFPGLYGRRLLLLLPPHLDGGAATGGVWPEQGPAERNKLRISRTWIWGASNWVYRPWNWIWKSSPWVPEPGERNNENLSPRDEEQSGAEDLGSGGRVIESEGHVMESRNRVPVPYHTNLEVKDFTSDGRGNEST